VVRNSLLYLTDADLRAMAWYLKSIPPDSALRTERHPHAAGGRGDDPLYRYCMGPRDARVLPPLAGSGHAWRVRSGGLTQSHSLRQYGNTMKALLETLQNDFFNPRAALGTVCIGVLFLMAATLVATLVRKAARRLEIHLSDVTGLSFASAFCQVLSTSSR